MSRVYCGCIDFTKNGDPFLCIELARVDFIESLGNVEAHMSKNTGQMNTFIRGLHYWSKAYCIPGKTIDVFRTDREKLLVSFCTPFQPCLAIWQVRKS
jgi:hypothetical protein